MAGEAVDHRAHFVHKWLAREPEMRFALLFCPAVATTSRARAGESERTRFEDWGALLHELRESLFELSDARVSAVKTNWWAEELSGLAEGRHRHPLTASLVQFPEAGLAPWPALARRLVEHDFEGPRASDTSAAVAVLMPLAGALVDVEAALFGAGSDDESARSIAVHWLLQRLPGGLSSPDQGRVPMHLLARHGLTPGQLEPVGADALVRDWGSELLAATPATLADASFLRRCRHLFDRARLGRLAGGQSAEPPAPLSLWRAWRLARTQ